MIAAFLQSGKNLGDGELYKRIVTFDGVFENLFKATEKWAGKGDDQNGLVPSSV